MTLVVRYTGTLTSAASTALFGDRTGLPLPRPRSTALWRCASLRSRCPAPKAHTQKRKALQPAMNRQEADLSGRMLSLHPQEG